MMTFDEYLNQTDPKRYPHVEVKLRDLKGMVRVVGGVEVTLLVHGKPYIYLIEPGCVHFHTLDEHGNKRGMACFRMDKPLEKKRDQLHPGTWYKIRES